MNSWIGDRKFYGHVLRTAVPIIIQQLVTNFVSLLDNIMVGQTGTLPMSAVSISNQLLNIFMLAIFGTVTGAGIYGAQFAGKRDWRSDQKVIRFKFLLAMLITGAFLFIFIVYGRSLLSLFMDSSVNTKEEIQATMQYASQYLFIMLWGLIPFALAQITASSIRETGQTVLPMAASIAAVAVNFTFNAILIFGLLGVPALGAAGAAIATVISRFVEMAVIMAGIWIKKADYPFLDGLFHSFVIGKDLTKDILLHALPLIANETLWSFGLAAIAQCYSTRGLNGVAAYNIANTISSLFTAVYIGSGNAISILTGHRLGMGDDKGAFITARRMTALIFFVCIMLGSILYILAPVFPSFYATSDEVKDIAASLLRVLAVFMPVQALYNSFYFILRSGGKTVITFFFDSVFTCTVSLGTAWFLSRYTGLNLVMMFTAVNMMDIIKVIIGAILVQKRVWIQNLTEKA